MPNVANQETERVEGYQIITEYLGKKGSIGGNGKEASSFAFSREAAEEYIAEVRIFNVTYGLQLIQGARFVQLPLGKIIDNGPKKPHSSS